MTVIEALGWSSNPEGFSPLADVIGIALHHTVTTISPGATPAEEEAHARAIDRYHVGQGWGGVGYHYLAFPSGRAYRVGWGQRAHVAYRNHELVGIAWVADLSGRIPSDIEIEAAADAVRDAQGRIGRDVPLGGHQAWAVPGWPTACPGRGGEVIPRVGEIARGQEEDEPMTPEERKLLEDIRAALTGGLPGVLEAWNENGNSLLVGYNGVLFPAVARLDEHIANHAAGVTGQVAEHTHQGGKVNRP